MRHHRVAETRRHGAMSRSGQALVVDRGGPLAISTRSSSIASDAEHKRRAKEEERGGSHQHWESASSTASSRKIHRPKTPAGQGHGESRFVAVVAAKPPPFLTVLPEPRAEPPRRLVNTRAGFKTRPRAP